MRRYTVFSVSILAALASFVPSIVSAKGLDLYNPKKHYGDEHTVITNASSRCTTAAFQALYASAQAQAKKDLAARGSSDAQVQLAYKTYQERIDLAWSAMQQPYCGFGAFGTTAAKKSFQKTISRARTDFFKNVVIPMEVPTGTSTSDAVPAAAPVVSDAPPTVSTAVAVAPAHVASSRKLVLTADMRMGESSREVQELQDLLVKKGYMSSDYATGYFGSHTKQAVIAFQEKKRIIASDSSPGAGLVGPRTLTALNG